MEEVFEINLPLLNKKALVRKSPYYLTIIRESLSNVSVDRLPLMEYFVFIDHPHKADQIKAKLFKTVAEDKWYDNAYSEEAESNSPEFGIPEINKEIKKAIDSYEAEHASLVAVSA
jgi:hypothetical protein